MCYWIQTKPGALIAETAVQHVTKDNMFDAETASQVKISNTAINERLDDRIFRIQHREGRFTL